jgi:2-polyprenyl-3-methyl-5-hydroxy-6-metoxy-1,4-benzoquinol methylase
MARVLNLLRKAAKRVLRIFGLKVTKLSHPRILQEVSGEFVDALGHRFDLLRGYRSAIWPMNWDKMIQERALPTRDTVRGLQSLSKGRSQVAAIADFLAVYGLSIEGRHVLEVGCFDGAACYAMKESGARQVHGVDWSRNFVTSSQFEESELRSNKVWLEGLRVSVKEEFAADLRGTTALEEVSFRDADIANLDEDEKYDLVVSSETVEHLLDASKAFAAMYKGLRKGGISVHRYHPFFCETGAHFDVLDFPWGHVRLNSEDFRRYIREFRPEEQDIAEYRFFRTINRFTISQLAEIATAAGFEIIEVFAPVSGWDKVTGAIYREARRNYPNVSLADLTATNVWLLLRKPA